MVVILEGDSPNEEKVIKQHKEAKKSADEESKGFKHVKEDVFGVMMKILSIIQFA